LGSSEPSSPAGYEARPATRDDLPAIDGLYDAYERAVGVLPESRSSYLGWRWSQPYVDVGRDTRVLADGVDVVGFSMVVDEGLGGPIWSMGCTHPAHAGRGVGSWIIERAVRHARDRGAPGVRATAPRQDRTARSLFEASAFARTRSSFDMGTPLDGTEVAGEPPAGVTLRAFVAGQDEEAAWSVSTIAFRDHWDHTIDVPYDVWRSEWFGDPADQTQVLLAEIDGVAVGELAWITMPSGAYVTSVGVLPEHRRHGVALALLNRAIADAAAAGHSELSLSVDSLSPTGAVALYERVGLEVWRTTDIFERETP
jgi:GNAT superfamily N-acetyltransferase